MAVFLRLLSAILVLVGVQQRPDSARATIVIVVRDSGPAAFVMQIPPGWDVARTHASIGTLQDDADPRGTPPSVVRWTGVVSDAALVWVELLALPGAKPGWAAVQVGDETVWIRAPGETTKPPVRRLWLPWVRRG